MDQLIQSGKYKNWSEIAPMVNHELFGDDESLYRDESAYRKACKYARDFYDAGVFTSEDKYMQELTIQKRELAKLKNQIQTEKLEYNKWLREEARDELIAEKICNTISTLPPITSPEYIEPVRTNESYLLAIADPHYGIEFSIKDLFGNIINEYSHEIFEQRMWILFHKLIQIIKRENIRELSIWELGDGINGIIRLNSQLMKLRYGIVDSSILYANFLANWLNALSEYVRIKFQMVIDSNHCQLRICNAPKNAFPEENMSKSMLVLIKERLKNNPNIVFIDNPTGMNYGLMSTYSVLGIHGEVKSTGSNVVDEFARTYQTHIDYLIMGHAHHKISEENGIDSECLVCRSIIGVDPYSMSLRRTSNPGATLFHFAQGEGLVTQHSIKL